MTKTAIAIRHVRFEDLGVFDDVLCRSGYAVRYCDAGIDEIGGVDPLAPDLIVVLGGPIGVSDEPAYPFLRDELRLLELAAVPGVSPAVLREDTERLAQQSAWCGEACLSGWLAALPA